jgi:hypothetical protein
MGVCGANEKLAQITEDEAGAETAAWLRVGDEVKTRSQRASCRRCGRCLLCSNAGAAARGRVPHAHAVVGDALVPGV